MSEELETADLNKDEKKPEKEESSEGCSLFVSNLTRNVSSNHLVEIFGAFGKVEKASVEFNKNNMPKGSAILEFVSAEDAESAMRHLDGGQLDGQTIKVSYVLVRQKRRRASPDRGVESSKATESKKNKDHQRGRSAENRRDQAETNGRRSRLQPSDQRDKEGGRARDEGRRDTSGRERVRGPNTRMESRDRDRRIRPRSRSPPRNYRRRSPGRRSPSPRRDRMRRSPIGRRVGSYNPALSTRASERDRRGAARGRDRSIERSRSRSRSRGRQRSPGRDRFRARSRSRSRSDSRGRDRSYRRRGRSRSSSYSSRSSRSRSRSRSSSFSSRSSRSSRSSGRSYSSVSSYSSRSRSRSSSRGYRRRR